MKMRKLYTAGANPEKVQGGAHAMDVWGFGGGAGHSPRHFGNNSLVHFFVLYKIGCVH